MLEGFNGRAVVTAGQAGYIHPGDIVHRMFNGNRHFDKSRLMHLWEDSAGIAAWTLLQPKHPGFDLQVRPDLHPEHQRRGIGRVLMAADLRQMRAAGLDTGMVCFEGDNPASQALYLGCGFEIVHEIIDYRKPIAAF